jgi:hypothetical protein
MKKTIIAIGLAGLAMSGALQAQTTYIEITGATAFRTAAVSSINNAFVAGGNFAVAYQSTASNGNPTSLTNGTYQIWKGTFPGITGTTVIRTSWNGSVEGIRAVADTAGASEHDPSFFKESEVGTPSGASPTPVGILHGDSDLEVADADMSFSDVAQAATPVTASLEGGPVGVVAFTMVANKTWKDDGFPTTSVSAQQFRALAGAGKLPLSFFTGSASDTSFVYFTGRNDGSGTRTTYLAETGYGITNPVTQYVVHDRTTPTIEKILKTAAGGGFNAAGTETSKYASTVWSQDQDGNGGYSSGGDLRSDLSKTSTNAGVWEFVDSNESGEYEAGEDVQSVAPAKLYLLTWLSYSDARSARGTGLASDANAAILGYNGVRLEGLAGDNPPSTMGAADRALIANGKYAAWSYQQLLHLGTTATTTVFNDLKSRMNSPAVIGSAGMALNEMNVSRVADGGVIQPGAL